MAVSARGFCVIDAIEEVEVAKDANDAVKVVITDGRRSPRR